MLYRSWQRDRTYRGFMLVKNYSCFAYEIAQNSSQHVRALLFSRDQAGHRDRMRDQAVNDTANLWQSILWQALGPERARQVRDSGAGERDRKWIPLLISRTAGHYPRLTITCPRCPFKRWVTPEEANRD
jgi:hypothetical protein